MALENAVSIVILGGSIQFTDISGTTAHVCADLGDSFNYQAENGGFGGIAIVGMQTGPHFGFEFDTIYIF